MLCVGLNRSKRIFFLLLLSLSLYPQFVHASAEVKTLAPVVDLNLGLVYWDRLSVPGGSSLSSSTPAAALDPTGSRTLGLEKARLGLSWVTIQGAGAKLVLRPDYSPSSGGQTRELDSRAGEVYSSSPTVRLLDAYSVVLNSYESLVVEIGVFEELLPRRVVYPELLEFGLNVALPRKFSGAKVNWQVRQTTGSMPGVESGLSKFQFMFVALHGSDDRADSIKIGRKTFDSGPASKDPYAGGAAYIGWVPSQIFSSGVLVGTGDHGFSRTVDAGQGPMTTRGRRSETFGCMSATLQVGQQKKSRIGMDFRLSHDSFSLTEGKASPLNQRSVSITYATPIKGSVHGFFGLHSGTSQLHELTDATSTKDVEGYQSDLGMIYAIDNNLEFALMAALERRSIKTSEGSRVGGFGDESPRNSIQRLGVRLNYFIPGS